MSYFFASNVSPASGTYSYVIAPDVTIVDAVRVWETAGEACIGLEPVSPDEAVGEILTMASVRLDSVSGVVDAVVGELGGLNSIHPQNCVTRVFKCEVEVLLEILDIVPGHRYRPLAEF